LRFLQTIVTQGQFDFTFIRPALEDRPLRSSHFYHTTPLSRATITMRTTIRLSLIQTASHATSVLASNGSYLPCALHFPATPANLDILAGYANGSYLNTPVDASSDVLGHAESGGLKPWPRHDDKDKKVVIEYCFETKNLRASLVNDFRDMGTNLWMQMLGDKASEKTGHAIEFRETVDEKGPMYCYEERQTHNCKSLGRNMMAERDLMSRPSASPPPVLIRIPRQP
jgi:hypothetical protein